MLTETQEFDAQQIFDCATNEASLYPVWCAMARAAANTTDGEWCWRMRTYTHELRRSRRYDGSINATVIHAAAFKVRDYYFQHIKES